MDRLIPPLTDAQRVQFVAAARSYLGAEFKHRGRSAEKMDCLGLVVLSMRDVGFSMVDRRAYGRDPVKDGIREAARAHFGNPIPLSDLQPGDLVLMQWHQQPNHVAVVGDYLLGGLSIIHSLLEAGRVVEQRLADPWPRRLLEGFRP